MNQISREFAPPFALIAPFFKSGILFYLMGLIVAFGYTFDKSYLDFSIIAWVHLVLLGFVMMIIFGALAQLIPVVLEVGHAFVDFFYIIRTLLFLGAIVLVFGFINSINVLPLAGIALLIAMITFSTNLHYTLKKSPLNTLVVRIIKMANIYLIIGSLTGLVMTVGLTGTLNIDVNSLLKLHVSTLLGGFVSLVLMAIALILLPMFGLSHNFKQEPIKWAYYGTNSAIMIAIVSMLSESSTLMKLSAFIAIVAFSYFSYQVYLIYSSRARKEHDIYTKSLIVALSALFCAATLLLLYLISENEHLLLSSAWFFIIGFLGFFITAHLYKIVPFLVWFERFSPLVGKEKVPMLHDMLPNNLVNAQLLFSTIGLYMVGIALIFSIDKLYYAGISTMVVNALFLIRAIYYMIHYGEKQ